MPGQGENPAKRQCIRFFPKNATCLAETGVEKEVFSIIWTLRDYSSLREFPVIRSPIFQGGPKTKHSWQLVVYPKEIQDDIEYLSIFLRLNNRGDGFDTDGRFVKATVWFILLNQDGKAVKKCRVPHSARSNAPAGFVKGGNMKGKSMFISSSDLLDATKNIVADDSFKIQCEITIIGDTTEILVNRGTPNCIAAAEDWKKRKTGAMASELGKIFANATDTDLIISVGQSTFKAHKAILIARSAVFAAMFNTNMLEKEENILKIPDFEEDVVKAMLEHLYSGQTEAMPERAPDLLKIAEKYQLLVLKADCEHVIADNLDFENVALVFKTAHTYNAAYLKQRAIDFINMNKKELLKRKDFHDAMKHISDCSDGVVDLYLSQSQCMEKETRSFCTLV